MAARQSVLDAFAAQWYNRVTCWSCTCMALTGPKGQTEIPLCGKDIDATHWYVCLSIWSCKGDACLRRTVVNLSFLFVMAGGWGDCNQS